jgi:hypothetical protein
MLVGRHYQNAYITRDLRKGIEDFKRYADVRTIMEAEVPVQLWTPAGEGTGTQKLAFIWIGDLQVELIQPGEEDVLSIYRDALPDDDRVKFHHICQRVDDWEAFMGAVPEQPFPMVLKGGTPGMLQFAYLDTTPWLGHYTEYVWMVPERWSQMGGR